MISGTAKVIGVVLLLAGTPAAAQSDWGSRDYNFATDTQNDFFDNFRNNLVDPVAANVRRKPATPPKVNPRAKAPINTPNAKLAPPARALVHSPAALPREKTVAYRMAMQYPPKARAEAEGLFLELLKQYGAFERTLRLPKGDLGGAIAAYITANWGSMNNVDVPDAHFLAATNQMRAILSANPGFQSLNNAQRQEIYETLVITGMFMATSHMALKKAADAAQSKKLRAAGRANLEQWFPGDSATLRIDANGLSFAP